MKRPIQSALILVAALGVGASGRYLAAPIEHQEVKVSAAISEQLLGPMRSLPIITLWQRASEAHDEGRYFEERAIYDLINEITPNNGAILRVQAMNEGRNIASEQATREAALLWIQSGLARLAEGRARRVRSDQAHRAEFMLGFLAGRAFPIEYSRALATSYNNKPLLAKIEEHAAKMPKSEAFEDFLSQSWQEVGLGNGLLASSKTSQLPAVARDWLRRSEALLWQSLLIVAEDAIEIERYQSSESVQLAIMVTVLAPTYLDDEAEIAALKAKQAPMIKREYQRLLDAGYPEYAESFKRVAEKSTQGAESSN